MQAVMETLVYLISVITIGILMVRASSGKSRQFTIFGWMAIILGGGDSFHLIPRVIALCTTGLDHYTAVLGVGKVVTSVTMTIFYLLPQNQWTAENPPEGWGIWRNIPFALLGVVVIILFFRSARGRQDLAFRHLWLTIVLSFGFYIPVVLFASRIPLMGMLMIPKTCAYMWTVLIGYKAMRKEIKDGGRRVLPGVYEVQSLFWKDNPGFRPYPLFHPGDAVLPASDGT